MPSRRSIGPGLLIMLVLMLLCPVAPASATPAIAPPFVDFYARQAGERILGQPLTDLVDGRQYFEKGRLEDRRGQGLPVAWEIAFGRLGAELVEQAADLPAAADSGPTYADLRRLAEPARRQPPPSPSAGVQGTADGAFVPFDSQLRAAPGQIVPPYFWTYINRSDLFPAGWLQATGLPLTAAFSATVRKGMLERTVVIQAFERTVLTYDPLNPAAWQVERANLGSQVMLLRQRPLPTPTPTPAPIPDVAAGWRGDYFTNADLLGQPALTRTDPAIEFFWGDGAPDPALPVDGFSVRWTSSIEITTRDDYEAVVDVAGGVRFWVGDHLLIDRWSSGGQTRSGIRLEAGRYPLIVEYRNRQGEARISADLRELAKIKNWRGAYYDNTEQRGSPEFVRDDRQIDFNWTNRHPGAGLRSRDYSVRWSRTLKLEHGTYRFTVLADNGIRLYVNNVAVLDRWSVVGGATSYTVDVAVNGSTPVRLDYRHYTGEARIRLTYVIL